MALNARKVKNNTGPKAPLVDAGAYPGRLVQVIDLGLHPQEFKGESKAPKNELWTTYESSDEFMPGEDGEPDESKPRWFSERFPLNNLDSDLAKSTKRYYALDPNEEEEGDWSKLLGRPAIIAIVQNGEYNNIASTSSMRKKEADKLPPLVNPTKLFSLDSPDIEVFQSLPQFLQDIIKSNLEFGGSKLEALLKGTKSPTKKEAVKTTTVDDDSIPFKNDGEDEESW